jgi:D-glycero-D-manno-heptose 1,7-bisphosphate phosphatase
MKGKKALFLDRDGVINVNHGYVFDAKNVDFVEGIFALIERFCNLDYQPVIVTNQSGIARGYYTQAQFFEVMEYFQKIFSEKGLPQIPVYFCPHHPDYPENGYEKGEPCQCRKPNPGMILEAAEQLSLNLVDSVFVGDKLSDMLAAKKAGIKTAFLIDPKHEQIQSLETNEYKEKLQNFNFTHVERLNLSEVPKTDSSV